MRIWHSSLIPKLCQKHLCAMWFEGGIAYNTVTGKTTGWKHHPAVKEFAQAPLRLFEILELVRDEMLKRGYHPRALTVPKLYMRYALGLHQENYLPYQSLAQQIEILKQKGCQCQI